jgi:hypothetical protein
MKKFEIESPGFEEAPFVWNYLGNMLFTFEF